MRKLLTMSLFLTTMSTAYAQSGNAHRRWAVPVHSIDIVGDISSELFPSLVASYGKLSALSPAERPSNVIDVTIASRGGSVSAMKLVFGYMERLKSAGYTFRCHAVYAMSAAFMIWARCDERTAFRKSLLMFHYPYYGFVPKVTADIAKEMETSLREDEAWFLGELSRALPFSSEQIDAWAREEKTWKGSELCEAAKSFCSLL